MWNSLPDEIDKQSKVLHVLLNVLVLRILLDILNVVVV